MPTLYWGGGSGTWNATSTANWYTDVGRTTLSTRAPSAEDDVVFDSASNATSYTVTNGTFAVCRDLTVSGPASGSVSFSGAAIIFVYGNITLSAAGITSPLPNGFRLYGTASHTITTNGVSINGTVEVLGGGTYTLQDAITLGGSASLAPTFGTLDTNGKTVTAFQMGIGGSGHLKLGASSVNINLATGFSGGTLDAGTSTITISNAGNGIGAAGSPDYAFYNVVFSDTGTGTFTINGNCSFNNLTFGTRSNAGQRIIALAGNITISGTLTIPGASTLNRCSLRSTVVGETRTVTAAAVSLTDVDFRDITAAGAAAPFTGTQLGDAGGNTSITFPASTTRYIAAGTASSSWYANIWSDTSGGAAALANFPLPQDSVVIDNAGLNTGATLTYNLGYVNGLTFASRTNAVTLASNGILGVRGDVTFSSAVTCTAGNALEFQGRNTQLFTTAGAAAPPMNINSPGGTVRLVDAYNSSARAITLTAGTFDSDGKSITCNSFTGTANSQSKTLTLGASTVTIGGSSGIGAASGDFSNLTVTSNTAVVNLSSSSVSIGFSGANTNFSSITNTTAAATAFTFYGNVEVINLTQKVATTTSLSSSYITLNGNLTVTGTLALGGGTSSTQLFGVIGSPLGTQRTLSAAAVTGMSDVFFRDIAATGAASWSGTRIGDYSGNSGITFTAPKTVYWNLAGSQNWTAVGWALNSGGTPAAANTPLPQDNVVFDDAGAAGTVTINVPVVCANLDMSARTSAMTFAGSQQVSLWGNFTCGSGVTMSHSGVMQFRKRSGSQVLTTAGKTLASQIQAAGLVDGTLELGDALITTNQFFVSAGKFDTKNYALTCSDFTANPAAVSINLGTSTLTSSGNFVLQSPYTLFFIGGSSTINLSGTAGKTFAGAGHLFGTVSVTGGTTTSTFSITGSNTFGTLSNTARNSLQFASGSVQTIANFTYTGDVTNQVFWRASTPGQRAFISTASNAVGTNSVDGGNNTGLSFTGTSNNYFYVKDIAFYVAPTNNFFLVMSNC